jgi:predicted lipid-binding transport protein (Tim44 family)
VPWEVDVPLSDNEQRLLEQMERALYAEDPKFASTMRGAARRGGHLPRMIMGIVAVLLGLVILVLGVANGNVLIGVVGFLAMLAGTAFAFSARRRGPTGVVTPNGTVRPSGGAQRKNAKNAKNAKSSFMQRMEQRWDRRRDQR